MAPAPYPAAPCVFDPRVRAAAFHAAARTGLTATGRRRALENLKAAAISSLAGRGARCMVALSPAGFF
jgi:hypothetical protein